MTSRIMVAAVFLVGCAVGGASSQLVVPKASAQQATLPRLEYSCQDIARDNITGAANRYAAQGWEMTSASTYGYVEEVLVCFKRPKL